MQPDILNAYPCPAGSASTLDQLIKWAIPSISAVFLLVTFLMTYLHNMNVRAGDLLLKLEEAFVKLGSKLAFLEYKATCYDPDIKRILGVSVPNPDSLKEWERGYLEDVDQCIRFLYICTLHAGTKIPPKGKGRLKQFFFPWRLVPKAYYFYLDKLNDEKKERPELRKYVERYFPLLDDWLRCNQVALKSYVTPSPRAPNGPGRIRTRTHQLQDASAPRQ